MDSITIDGMEEMEFRRSIESMLRRGKADDAADRLKSLLNGYAGEGRLLPERFLTVSASDIHLEGWERLGDRLNEYDRPEMSMSAISVDILDPQGVGVRPDPEGRLKPVIETSYFSDSAYPFSEADREDLLDGYSSFGCEWQGNFENVDTTISVEGIDDLYGATVGLENKVANSSKVEPEDIRAGSIGSCYLAVLIHQAIRDAAREKGLPRPICVLSGNNDAYPFFDAPAMTIDEYRQDGKAGTCDDEAHIGEFDEDLDGEGAEAVGAGGMASLDSLLGLGAKKKEKKPVLTIDPSEADTAESLGLPVPAEGEPEERLHIMPALDLGAGPPPESAEPPREDAMAAHQQAELNDWTGEPSPVPADFDSEGMPPDSRWDALTPEEPVDFGALEPPTPIDFSAYQSPTPPAPAADEPVAPIEFDADQPQEPAQFGEEDSPPPIERLYSEDTVPDERASGPEQGFDGTDHGWDEPEQGTPWSEERSAPPDSGWDEPVAWPSPDIGSHDTEMPGLQGPLSADDVPPPAQDLRSGFETGSEPAGPSDIDRFAYPEEPTPDDWASAYDLPTADETGDNLPCPDSGPNYHDVPPVEVARPARHSIRVIAASVTNEGNERPAKTSIHANSPLLRLVGAIASALDWLWNRMTRR